MDVLWEELTFGLPERRQLIQVIIRLTASVIIAGIVGFQRESVGKDAGLRTHILVSIGSTVFILACIGSGMREDAISRVMQGIITGIGFIGAGAILKREDRIEGLTTSAGLWTTCAIGVLIGIGELGIAIIAAVVTFIVLAVAGRVEKHYRRENGEDNDRESVKES